MSSMAPIIFPLLYLLQGIFSILFSNFSAPLILNSVIRATQLTRCFRFRLVLLYSWPCVGGITDTRVTNEHTEAVGG